MFRIFIFFAFVCNLLADVCVINSNSENVNCASHIYILEENRDDLKIDDVLNSEFKKSEATVIGYKLKLGQSLSL